MLRGWAFLLAFQLAGEALTLAIGWSIPGPVVGMALLLVALEVRRSEDDGLRAVSSGLLSNLSLLFVPAGVGVMLHAKRLVAEWPALLVSVLVSTGLTLAVTGWVAQRLSAARAGGEERSA
jgi:holin-like protein